MSSSTQRSISLAGFRPHVDYWPLAIGKAKLIKDKHVTAYESDQEYEFSFPTIKPRSS